MAIWPESLPCPRQNSCSVTLGENALHRTMQSGQKEVRRYGSAAPDLWTLNFLLLKAHHEYGDQTKIFAQFYRNDLNFGVNWFSAAWIAAQLGYPDHLAKLVEYPVTQFYGLSYHDVSAKVIIQKASAIKADTSWPVANVA